MSPALRFKTPRRFWVWREISHQQEKLLPLIEFSPAVPLGGIRPRVFVSFIRRYLANRFSKDNAMSSNCAKAH